MRWALFSTFILFSAILIFPAGCEPQSEISLENKYPRYITTVTPVFNTPDLRKIFGGPDGNTLKTDKKGLIRELETVLLPGSDIKVLEEIKIGAATMLRIESQCYPYSTKTGYYIDSRFNYFASYRYTPKLPSQGDIIKNMLAMNGARYVWGGNYAAGIPEMLKYYPPSKPVSGIKATRWMLKGLDCSGLLYQATDGLTPRNTSALIKYGNPVNIENLSPKQIAAKLEPLDLIVWKGHVIIVLNKTQAIESSVTPAANTGLDGVRIVNLIERLTAISKTRKPVNDYSKHTKKRFVIRRWYKPELSNKFYIRGLMDLN